jgi:hypothetical protein
MIQVEHEGDFRVDPVHILDQKVKVLRNQAINLVKVQWTYCGIEDAMWEHEEAMWKEYLHLFCIFLRKYECTYV